MTCDNTHQPRQYLGVMVSSTFTDLEKHRRAAIRALKARDLFAIAMENKDRPNPVEDLIDSSLKMVRESVAYIGVISSKYGQIPKCTVRNPDNLSITELEFNEAQSLGLPILLFIMGEGHSIKRGDVETDAKKIAKLEKFREKAKRMSSGSRSHRIYCVFNDLNEFERKAIQSIADLKEHLDKQAPKTTAPLHAPQLTFPKKKAIPSPPDFHASPPYIGSHKFVGRSDKLVLLSNWASSADQHPVLLLEAIGGSGKSMLTWEWVNNHAPDLRNDWAGRFWYSFYERGADMSDFCRQTLAYMTARPVADFRQKKTAQMTEQIIMKLRAKPWLLVLDGLERVLVTYNRFDAPQLCDEDVESAGDVIADRDPCAAIHKQDDDLLRAMVAGKPSKLLLTSRLIPSVLLNQSRHPIPGVKTDKLHGLNPEDAEELILSCGISGNSDDIRTYLQENCDNHPLVIGVLAGLINDYLPGRGNFDKWVKSPVGGIRLNLAILPLVQKQNHILKLALDALSNKSRQLLSTLALLYWAADYETISALNPHLPPKPEKVSVPGDPEKKSSWKRLDEKKKDEHKAIYEKRLKQRHNYEQTLHEWQQSKEVHNAPAKLADTVRDLERRGLVQYDILSKHYDLHPVVRSVAAGSLLREETSQLGQHVIDHFTQRQHKPCEQAETLSDVANGLQIVSTLLQMGRLKEAVKVFHEGLDKTLNNNLEAHAQILSLLSPLFPNGWQHHPKGVSINDVSLLYNDLGRAFGGIGQFDEAIKITEAKIILALGDNSRRKLCAALGNMAIFFLAQNSCAKSFWCRKRVLDLERIMDAKKEKFEARLRIFVFYSLMGDIRNAEIMWSKISDYVSNESQDINYKIEAESFFAFFLYKQGKLNGKYLSKVERLARENRNRHKIRNLHYLRGLWHFENDEWVEAIDSLRQAVSMSRQIGITEYDAEARLVLAESRNGADNNSQQQAERLSECPDSSALDVAELWHVLGDQRKATKHALRAHKWAVADGEPYVHRFELDKTTVLLKKLGVIIPPTPAFDEAKDKKSPWQFDVEKAIETFHAEKEKKKNENNSKK